MVVAVVLIGTFGKVAQAFAGRRGSSDADQRVRALESSLQSNEMRLAQTEERVNELTEKLGFFEELLASPERRGELPRPAPRRED